MDNLADKIFEMCLILSIVYILTAVVKFVDRYMLICSVYKRKLNNSLP